MEHFRLSKSICSRRDRFQIHQKAPLCIPSQSGSLRCGVPHDSHGLLWAETPAHSVLLAMLFLLQLHVRYPTIDFIC